MRDSNLIIRDKHLQEIAWVVDAVKKANPEWEIDGVTEFYQAWNGDLFAPEPPAIGKVKFYVGWWTISLGVAEATTGNCYLLSPNGVTHEFSKNASNDESRVFSFFGIFRPESMSPLSTCTVSGWMVDGYTSAGSGGLGATMQFLFADPASGVGIYSSFGVAQELTVIAGATKLGDADIEFTAPIARVSFLLPTIGAGTTFADQYFYGIGATVVPVSVVLGLGYWHVTVDLSNPTSQFFMQVQGRAYPMKNGAVLGTVCAAPEANIWRIPGIDPLQVGDVLYGDVLLETLFITDQYCVDPVDSIIYDHGGTGTVIADTGNTCP